MPIFFMSLFFLSVLVNEGANEIASRPEAIPVAPVCRPEVVKEKPHILDSGFVEMSM
jgi:hypothetical protein